MKEKDTLRREIAERIKKARKAAGLTQAEVAGLLGITYQAVSNYERGINSIENSVLSRMCEIYHVSVSDILPSENKKDAPAGIGERVTEDDIKFALFGGDGEITDEMFEEVKRFAAYVKAREKR